MAVRIALVVMALCATTPWLPSAEVVDGNGDGDDRGLVLDLATSLRLAFTQGRERLTRQEDLELVAHELRVVRRDYGPRLSGDVDGEVTIDSDQNRSRRVDGRIGVAQDLPTGGRLSAGVEGGRTETDVPEATTYDDSLSLSLTQPLLRNAGSLVWRENLTASEREFIYAKRGYRLFLHDLSLEVAREFWRLQELRFRIDSNEAEVERSEFSLRQARAFLDLGRTTPNDVLRAEVGLLQARQSLVDAKAIFAAALDRFKVDLNIPVDEPVRIIGDIPTLPPLRIDGRLAIDLALNQRVDLRTVRDRIADAERDLRLSRNQILPDVDLRASARYDGAGDELFDETFDERPEYRVGLNVEIPFERHRERLAYDRALTRLAQVRRDADLRESQVIREVQAALRDLRQAAVSLQIQERNVEQTRKRLIKSRMDYEAGLISNRDLVEAQSEVRDADIARFSAVIAYRSAELQLRRDTGVMVVDASGHWRDDLPPYVSVVADPVDGAADEADPEEVEDDDAPE